MSGREEVKNILRSINLRYGQLHASPMNHIAKNNTRRDLKLSKDLPDTNGTLNVIVIHYHIQIIIRILFFQRGSPKTN